MKTQLSNSMRHTLFLTRTTKKHLVLSNYAEMYNGTEGMTIGILLRGGACAKIKSGIIVAVNSYNSCPMRGLPDDLQYLSYGSGRRG